MRIAVNTRLMLPGKMEGIGWFTYETLNRITRDNPGHEFLFLFDRPWSDQFVFSGNVTPMEVKPPARHPLLWYTWFEYSLPGVMRRWGADLFLSPDGYVSLSSDTPSVAVIHDINFMHHPEFHPFLTREYYRRFFPRFASKAVRIVTVSDYSRNDIIETFGVSPDKVDVVYNGAGDAFYPLNGEDKGAVINEITGGSDYFLFVGSFHRRKNITGLLRAYELFRKRNDSDIKLVLAGEKMYGYPEMRRTISKMSFGHDIIFAGYKEPSRLRMLYGASLGLVYVPLFEGFGIPLLEAMNCDTPVIASNCTSVPEVAGDAAHMADPENAWSVAEGMERLATDENYRQNLVERGRQRRKMFSWDQTARLLWKSVERAMPEI